MGDNHWFIETVSLSQDTLPSKEEMEKLLLPLPPGWKAVNNFFYAKNGQVIVRLGHVNPDPVDIFEGMKASAETGLVPGLTVAKVEDLKNQIETLYPQKFDYTADLTIIGCADKQTAKQFFESYQTIPTQGLSAKVLGATIDTSLSDLIKVFAPKEMAKEVESALEKGKKELADSGVKIEKGKHLGEKALFHVGKNGKKGCMAILINNFVITGMLSVFEELEAGSTPIHSVKCEKTWREHEPLRLKGKHDVSSCKACSCHSSGKTCSTLEKEGFIHREMVETLLKDIFSRIKGKVPEKETSVNIIRKSEKIENPSDGFKIKDGDTIKTGEGTKVKLADNLKNEISIGGGSTVKVDNQTGFELSEGTIGAMLKKTEKEINEKLEKYKEKYGEDAFKVRTPQSICCPRGTIFSVWTDKNTTTLTVVKGKVEFSDLKGNKVIVSENQFCVCSKEQGLQKPVTAPFNLKEKFKEGVKMYKGGN